MLSSEQYHFMDGETEAKKGEISCQSQAAGKELKRH